MNEATQKYIGEKITLEKFMLFLKVLEQDFTKKGYPMVRVFFGKQILDSENAKPEVHIISGVVEKIDIQQDNKEAVDDEIKKVVLNVLASLKNREYLDSKTINQKMLILESVYGLSSKIFLSRGVQQGGFVVNVKVLYKDIQKVVSFKNSLEASYGHYSIQGMFAKNFIKNGVSHRITALPAMSLKQTSDVYYRSLTLGYSQLWATGSTIDFNVSQSRTASRIQGAYKSYSQGTRASIMYRTPVVLNPMEKFYVSRGLQYGNNITKNKNTNSYQYRDISVDLVLGGDYTLRTPQGLHNTTFSLNQAVNILGAKYTKVNQVSSSRSGVTGKAIRLNGNYVFVKNFTNGETLTTAVNFQHTFNQAVLSSQQYSGTGFQRVQGLIGTGLSGDGGYSFFGEYKFAPKLINKQLFAPFVSASYSEVNRIKPTAVEKKYASANSVSIGFSTPLLNTLLFKNTLSYSESHDKKVIYDTSINASLVYYF